MQWSQIKTLFILCFLILDVFLIYQFIDKQKASDLGLLERQDVTIEQQLADDKITIKQLPEYQSDKAFISVKQKEFTKKERNMLEQFNNQDIAVIDNHLIVSQFKDNVSLPKLATVEQIEEIVKENVIFSSEYEFGGWNQDLNVIFFFQTKNDWPIFFNSNGIIIVYLNEKNEMVFYTQTMLDEAKINSEKKALIQPMEAVGKVYENNKLQTGETITELNVGYHTVVPLANGVQVFVPTWKIVVEKKRHYFVNAIEGVVFPGNDREFLNEEILSILDKVHKINKKITLKDSLIKQLNKKLEDINRSEIK